MNARLKLRARILLIAILFFAVSIIANLYRIQIIKGEYYSKKANDQYVRPVSSLIDRGSIFFSTKDGTNVQVASIKTGYQVFINPDKIKNPEAIFEALSEYIKIDKSDYLNKVKKVEDPYEELVDQIEESKALSIKGLGILGLGVTKESWRIYPADKMASHEVGILGESASSTLVVGKYGLERSYENVLRRKKVSSNTNALAQLFIDLKEVPSDGEKEGDIVTSLELTTQKYLEKVLLEIDEAWHPDLVGGIVMNPNNGEIIAMSSLPTFDPNNISNIQDIGVLSNPLVESVYEMGSIVKPLTMAVALDNGAVYPDSTYEDTGTMTLSGKEIANHDRKARGIVSMQEILSQSLNVGAATIALEVGKEAFSKYFIGLGFGSKTGIDLPNEASGLVNNLRTGRDVEIATIAYGQGVAVSPISITRSLSVLANGGYLVTPHLVKEIKYSDGSIKKIEPNKSKRVISKKSTEDVTKMLVKVVDKSLLNGSIKNDRYSISAKTGTAQIANPKGGGYYEDKFLHSFFGYFPAYKPRFIVFLYQVNPKETDYAANTLTMPFDKLSKFLISYFDIAPDR